MESISELEGISFVETTVDGLMPADLPFGTSDNVFKLYAPFPGREDPEIEASIPEEMKNAVLKDCPCKVYDAR